jgi:hypothetical protein
VFAEPATATAIRPARERGTKPRWEALRHLLTPLVLAAVIGGLYLWVSAQSLDSIERRTLNADYIITRVSEHLKLTAVAVLLVVVIAIPLGVVLSRRAARSACWSCSPSSSAWASGSPSSAWSPTRSSPYCATRSSASSRSTRPS